MDMDTIKTTFLRDTHTRTTLTLAGEAATKLPFPFTLKPYPSVFGHFYQLISTYLSHSLWLTYMRVYNYLSGNNIKNNIYK